MNWRLVILLLCSLLLLTACGGSDDASDSADTASATPATDATLVEPSATVDTSVELPPAVTVDLSSRSNVRTIEPGADAVQSQATLAIEGESTLPPAVIRPTNTFPPAPTRPTRTPRPTEPTRTPLPTRTPRPTITLTPTLMPGMCDGFVPDFETNDANELVVRGESFTIVWFAPEAVPQLAYLVRIYNSNAGQIYEADTDMTTITIPGPVTDRRSDTFLFWQVIVLSDGRDIGCPALDGEVRLVG